MGRILSIRNLLGLILIGLGAACPLILAELSLSPAITVVVANADMKPGDLLTVDKFHEAHWMGLDGLSQDNIITLDNWPSVEGGRVAFGQEIHAGHPVSLSQVVFDKKLNDAVSRTTLLAAADKVVVPIDVLAGQVGNGIEPGDYVDLIFTVGQVPTGDLALPTLAPPANALESPGATPQPALPGISAAQATPGVVQLPLATVPLLNVHVLRVDHDQKQVYTTNSSGQQVTRQVDGDVKRIYVELSEPDATIVGFLLQSGKVLAVSHLSPLPTQNQMVGLSWTDFVTWFESHRPDLFAGRVGGAQPGQPNTAAMVKPTPASK